MKSNQKSIGSKQTPQYWGKLVVMKAIDEDVPSVHNRIGAGFFF